MQFSQPLTAGVLRRRHQRFLADIALPDGRLITAHCPNPGRMTTCAEPGWPVLISRAANPARKLPWTWELAHNGRCWICVNTARANQIAGEALRRGVIPELRGYGPWRAEVSLGVGTRLDFAAAGCYVEVKSVTLLGPADDYRFPDAVTARGRRHLAELARLAATGAQAVLLFIVQRSDGAVLRPADDIDPAYGVALREAVAAGVRVLAWQAHVAPTGMALAHPVPCDLEDQR